VTGATRIKTVIGLFFNNNQHLVDFSGRTFIPLCYLMAVDKQEKYDRAYLTMAQEWAKLSYCRRKQVGALIVRQNMIISDGYNGTPSGYSNACEDDTGDTHWYVLHAEANAILKVAKSTQSAEGATLYVTLSPCKECSKLIIQSGIKRVVYSVEYKDSSGVQFLREYGIESRHLAEV